MSCCLNLMTVWVSVPLKMCPCPCIKHPIACFWAHLKCDLTTCGEGFLMSALQVPLELLWQDGSFSTSERPLSGALGKPVAKSSPFAETLTAITLQDPGAPPHRKLLDSTTREPRTLKSVAARSATVRHRIRQANRPFPNFVLLRLKIRQWHTDSEGDVRHFTLQPG